MAQIVRPYRDRMPVPVSPGDVLEKDWLEPLDVSQSELARRMGVNVQVVNGIVQGRRAVTAKTAILLADVTNTTAQFWMNLQTAWDLWHANEELRA